MDSAVNTAADAKPKTDAGKLADAIVTFGELGGKIDNLGGNCPVQAEGSIGNKRFYFRARGTNWQFHLADTDEDLWHNQLLFINRPYSDDRFAAGWMAQHEAVGFMIEGARLWKLQRELMEAHEGQGNADRIGFIDWVRNMADNNTGTLQEAAKRFLAEVIGDPS